MSESSGSGARPRSASPARQASAPATSTPRSSASPSADAQRVAELEQRIAILEREATQARALVSPPLELVIAWPSLSGAFGRMVRRAVTATTRALHHRLSF